jgi:hypothetical protein
LTNPITGIAGCCEYAVSGHATAVPPSAAFAAFTVSLTLNSKHEPYHAIRLFEVSAEPPKIGGVVFPGAGTPLDPAVTQAQLINIKANLSRVIADMLNKLATESDALLAKTGSPFLGGIACSRRHYGSI